MLFCFHEVYLTDMSQYYNPRRYRNIFDPASTEPFRLSRSKIDLFIECPRCFYLDRRLGTSRPPGFPFSLNAAVDALLKKEFDIHRKAKTPHPLMESYGIDAIPFEHEKLPEWRDNFKGVEYYHAPTNFIVSGAIDDVWIMPENTLIVVDYKATSKNGEVNIDADWQKGYKRQMEIYQWLLRNNNFTVSNTGYFVYVNGKTDRKAFDGKLEFDVSVIAYTGNDSWIEKVLLGVKNCLMANAIPQASKDCDWCRYRKAVRDVE